MRVDIRAQAVYRPLIRFAATVGHMTPNVIGRAIQSPPWKLVILLAAGLGTLYAANYRLAALETKLDQTLSQTEQTDRRVQALAERVARMEGAHGAPAPRPVLPVVPTMYVTPL